MSAIETISIGEYEQVLIVQERETGLTSITAVHDTTLGPALGGLRMRDYATLEEALADVLGLARAMTYKNSLCGCNLGGGKSVIVGPSNQLSYAASLAVSDNPSKSYNPLFIHGSNGLGKTHLLQAICHQLLSRKAATKILLLSCETFINQFISEY